MILYFSTYIHYFFQNNFLNHPFLFDFSSVSIPLSIEIGLAVGTSSATFTLECSSRENQSEDENSIRYLQIHMQENPFAGLAE